MFNELQSVNDSVWIYPHDKSLTTVQPNVGVIASNKQTILVDSGNSPRHARRVMASLLAMGAPPVDYIIYTHHHWDHTFGAMTFSVPVVVAHERCQVKLREAASKPWSGSYLREEVYRNPLLETQNGAIERAIDDWRGFRIVQPTMTFSTMLTLYLDDLTLDLYHVGGRHSDDSIVIAVKEAGVAFVGDCFYSPPIHERLPGAKEEPLNINVFEQLFSQNYSHFVDGHGSLMTKEMMQHTIEEYQIE